MLQWNGCSISTGRELNYSSMNISLQSLWRMNLLWNLFLAVIRSNNSAGARNTSYKFIVDSLYLDFARGYSISITMKSCISSLLFSCLSRDIVQVVTNNLLYLISYCSFLAISWCGSTRTSTSRKILWSRHLRNPRKVSHYGKNKPFLVFFFPSENSNFFLCKLSTAVSYALCLIGLEEVKGYSFKNLRSYCIMVTDVRVE